MYQLFISLFLIFVTSLFSALLNCMILYVFLLFQKPVSAAHNLLWQLSSLCFASKHQSRLHIFKQPLPPLLRSLPFMALFSELAVCLPFNSHWYFSLQFSFSCNYAKWIFNLKPLYFFIHTLRFHIPAFLRLGTLAFVCNAIHFSFCSLFECVPCSAILYQFSVKLFHEDTEFCQFLLTFICVL